MQSFAPETIAALLSALGERLALAQTRVELVVIGGSSAANSGPRCRSPSQAVTT